MCLNTACVLYCCALVLSLVFSTECKGCVLEHCMCFVLLCISVKLGDCSVLSVKAVCLNTACVLYCCALVLSLVFSDVFLFAFA